MIYPYIALCGWPTAGKSTIQRLLHTRYGYEPQDDGRVLRDAAKRLYGLTDWHVETQDGKKTLISVGGTPWSVRKILGELGNYLESQHGESFMPLATLRDCLALYPEGAAPKMSFGSVRKGQGHTWREKGALVVEVFRPELAPPENAFDRYDPTAVMVKIVNDRPGIEAFEAEAIRMLDPVLSPV